ncbi:hypothetical protein NPIL_703281, partial [Nephila pilipes]
MVPNWMPTPFPLVPLMHRSQ